MSKKFLISLIERVVSMFAFTFLATYAAGIGGTGALNHVFNLSLGQKAGAAALAAVIQLLVSVFVGSQIGDKDSASLLPSFLLHKIPATPAQAQAVVVSVDDVVKATLSKVAEKYPNVTVTAEDVANKLIMAALTTAAQPAAAVAPPK